MKDEKDYEKFFIEKHIAKQLTEDLLKRTMRKAKWYKVKWYAFTPLIGYTLWEKKADSLGQLKFIFFYQVVVAMFLLVYFGAQLSSLIDYLFYHYAH